MPEPEPILMPETPKFRIKVKTLEGNILVFRNVDSYEASNGLIFFTDSKTGIKKIFSVALCEISDEVSND